MSAYHYVVSSIFQAISLSLADARDPEEEEVMLAMAVSIACASEEEEKRRVLDTDANDEMEQLDFAVAMSLSEITALDDEPQITESEALFECQ